MSTVIPALQRKSAASLFGVAIMSIAVCATITSLQGAVDDRAERIPERTEREEGGRRQALAERTPALTRAVVQRAERTHEPVNRMGRHDVIQLEPLEVIEVTLQNPAWRKGSRIFAYTVNGGRVNGKITDRILVEVAGEVTFTFQSGRYFGDYPVVLRQGGREEVLNFWVNRADLHPERAEER